MPFTVCDVVLSLYLPRANRGGNETCDPWKASPIFCQLRYTTRSPEHNNKNHENDGYLFGDRGSRRPPISAWRISCRKRTSWVNFLHLTYDASDTRGSCSGSLVSTQGEMLTR